MEIVITIGKFLIFPGLFFTTVAGLFASWIDRKLTARVQWRKGPPLLQPFYDIIKLWGKDTILPKSGNRILFILAPMLGLAGITLVSLILWNVNLFQKSFIGDLIVIVYLLVLPSLAIILGGSASGNPLASQGASREIKLLLAYELPFLFCIALIIIKNNGSLQLTEIMQQPLLNSISGVMAFIVILLCVQAKLGFVPFDIAEAETELMSGVYIEYSGVLLSIFKIMQAMMLFTLPVLVSTLFLGGLVFYGWEILWSVLKIVGILAIIIVIKNTNPRVRIDQAVKFFWGFCGTIALIAIILAIIGSLYAIPWL